MDTAPARFNHQADLLNLSNEVMSGFTLWSWTASLLKGGKHEIPSGLRSITVNRGIGRVPLPDSLRNVKP